MRGKRSKKRVIIPDPIFKSKVVARTINAVMTRGKKSIAKDIVYGSITKLNAIPVEIPFKKLAEMAKRRVRICNLR